MHYPGMLSRLKNVLLSVSKLGESAKGLREGEEV